MSDPDQRDHVDFIYRTMGAAIRRRRRELRLTQRDTADLSGVGVVFVIEVEAGKRTVRLDRLIALMATLGLRFRIEDGGGGIVVADALR